ncbi:MAG: FAD-binding protein, partial [Chitinophagaceae bacterium]
MFVAALNLPEFILMAKATPGMRKQEGRQIKNREARLYHPAGICRPTEIDHIQQCVQWALGHGASLTIIGGGHSGHCVWDNIVSVDMGAFSRVYIHSTQEEGVPIDTGCDALVVAEAGCTTGDIITKAMAAEVT